MVDASHLRVGDEDPRHLVVSDVTEQLVEAAISPRPADDEEVAVGAELRVRIALHQQAVPVRRLVREAEGRDAGPNACVPDAQSVKTSANAPAATQGIDAGGKSQTANATSASTPSVSSWR